MLKGGEKLFLKHHLVDIRCYRSFVLSFWPLFFPFLPLHEIPTVTELFFFPHTYAYVYVRPHDEEK